MALSGFFGLFTFSMTAASLRYVFTNLTNVDALKRKTVVYQLAVRVPHGTPVGPHCGVVTYPLQKDDPNFRGQFRSESGSGPSSGPSSEPVSARDLLATRTFAIVGTEIGENPWDLGLYGNWVSIMGTNILDWFLPFRQSPCAVYENNESFYKMGPLYSKIRQRFNLPELLDEKGGVEMKELQKGRA
jgi:palmitoyltransferase